MIDLLIWIGVGLLTLFILIKSADYFLEYVTKVGVMLQFPPIFIGLFLVSFGSSLPELVSAITAASQKTTPFVSGIAIGSSIANIAFVVGICLLIAGNLKNPVSLSRIDIPCLLLSLVFVVLVSIDTKIVLLEGIFMILFYIAYAAYRARDYVRQPIAKSQNAELSFGHGVIIILSAVGLYVSSNFLIKSVIRLTKMFELPDTSFLAMSAVTVALALPELIIGYKAIKKGNTDVFIGNIIGANIFNCLVVLAIPSFFSTLTVATQVLFTGFPTLILLTGTYYLFLKDKAVMTRFEGIGFVIIFILFILKVFL